MITFYQSLLKRNSIIYNSKQRLSETLLISKNSDNNYTDKFGLKNQCVDIVHEVNIISLDLNVIVNKVLSFKPTHIKFENIFKNMCKKISEHNHNYIDIELDSIGVLLVIRKYDQLFICIVLSNKQLPNKSYLNFLSDYIYTNYNNYSSILSCKTVNSYSVDCKEESNKQYTNDILLNKIYEKFILKECIFHYEKMLYAIKRLYIPQLSSSYYYNGFLSIDKSRRVLISDFIENFSLFKNSHNGILSIADQQIINEIIFQGSKLEDNYKSRYSCQVDYSLCDEFITKVELTSTYPRISMYIKFLPVYKGIYTIHFYSQNKISRVFYCDQSDESFYFNDHIDKTLIYKEIKITSGTEIRLDTIDNYEEPIKVVKYELFLYNFLQMRELTNNNYYKNDADLVYFNKNLFEFIILSLEEGINSNSIYTNNQLSSEIDNRILLIYNNLRLFYEEKSNLKEAKSLLINSNTKSNYFLKISFEILLSEMFFDNNKLLKHLETNNTKSMNQSLIDSPKKIRFDSGFMSELENDSFLYRNSVKSKILLNKENKGSLLEDKPKSTFHSQNLFNKDKKYSVKTVNDIQSPKTKDVKVHSISKDDSHFSLNNSRSQLSFISPYLKGKNK